MQAPSWENARSRSRACAETLPRVLPSAPMGARRRAAERAGLLAVVLIAGASNAAVAHDLDPGLGPHAGATLRQDEAALRVHHQTGSGEGGPVDAPYPVGDVEPHQDEGTDQGPGWVVLDVGMGGRRRRRRPGRRRRGRTRALPASPRVVALAAAHRKPATIDRDRPDLGAPGSSHMEIAHQDPGAVRKGSQHLDQRLEVEPIEELREG